MRQNQKYALGLGCLAGAFLLRVLGQVLVAFFHVDFLPPMKAWYSGLIPYHILLPVQIIILALQWMISRDIWRNSGVFAGYRPRVGRGLCWFSYVYFLGMLLRYILAMAHYPERRWFGGTIPIFFHFVLAGYLYLWGRYFRRIG
jgi:hypothetical protein